VVIPERELQVNQWTGVGYIVSDPATGAAGYLISGGIAGGSGTQEQSLSDILGRVGAFTLKFISCLLQSDNVDIIVYYLLALLALPQIIKFLGTVLSYIGVALVIIIVSIVILECILASLDARFVIKRDRLLSVFFPRSNTWKNIYAT
jgi:hypothetical protein